MKRCVVVFSFALLAACHPLGGNPHSVEAAHASGAGPHGPKASGPTDPNNVTVDIQGGRMDCSHPMVTGFYAISREAFAGGADKVDLETYKQKTFGFMRAGILKEGGTEKDVQGWIDHIKDIPRQMIGIVKEDPSVLETCEKFSVALSGPA